MEDASSQFLYPFYSIPMLSDCFSGLTDDEKAADEKLYQKHTSFISNLPTDDGKIVFPLYQYQGFWFSRDYLRGMQVAHNRFEARRGDTILASCPKSGTTWLKALMFSIIHRPLSGQNHLVRGGDAAAAAEVPSSLLHVVSPHELFPFLEGQYMGKVMPRLDALPSPRLFNTHAPCSLLPDSVKSSASGCKIVYVCRELKDNFVSWWHYRNGISPNKDGLDLDGAFERYCSGMFPWGPVWEHMLGYWEAQKKDPSKVLFLKYEDVKKDVKGTIKKLGELMGRPFSPQEDRVVEDIARFCSFESLSNLEVNRNGKMGDGENAYRNKVFFRRGKVGDWRNLLTPQMVQELNRITEQKLMNSGLSFL